MTIDNPRNPQELTPEQVAVLAAWADNAIAGRRWAVRLFKGLVIIGTLVGAVTAIIHGWSTFWAWRGGN